MKKCILCDGINLDTIYNGQIRSGSFKKLTTESFAVIKCKSCGIGKLEPFPKLDYTSSEYRELYNDTSQISKYIQMHDHEQIPRISSIGIEKFRNKVIADLGCGGGSFLDAVKGVASKTIGIEPFTGYHKSLKNRGHEVFSSIEEIDAKYLNNLDIIISFGVIEHTNNPIEYLQGAFTLLKKNGELYIETDNVNDFLMGIELDEFKQFFYRTSHYWYFDDSSLKKSLEIVGFENIKVGFRHGYDLSNTLLWLRDRIPTGVGKIKSISKNCNSSWVNYLEQSGQAELLHFSAVK